MSVTINRVGGTDIERSAEFYGKSTDTKPTVDANGQPLVNGSVYVEMDTSEVYFYDADTKSWLQA
jgi:hypothetical protein